MQAHAELRLLAGRAAGPRALHRADRVSRRHARARSTLIRAESNYLYAEFRTPLMRYVDDVELYYDERAGLVHVRSASRLGRRDFGVNRKRVEELRAVIQARR